MRIVVRLTITLLLLGLCGGFAAYAVPNHANPSSQRLPLPRTATAPASPVSDGSAADSNCQKLVTTEEDPYRGGIVGMTLEADLIAEGTVIDATPPTLGSDGSTSSITTDYVFRVEARLADISDSSVLIRRAGGQVGCQELLNAVSPVLNIGDHLLLFLVRDQRRPEMPQAYRLLGQGQGYWQLKTETTAAGSLDIAAKFYRSDTGAFGDPHDRELVHEISDRVRQTIASGPPPADDGQPTGFHVNIDYIPSAVRPDQLVGSTDLIVTGKVIDVLPPRWTTLDGARPANFAQMVPIQYTIITPAVVELDGPPIINDYGPLGDARQVIVATERGQVNGSSVDFGPELIKGDHILLFLSYSRELGNGFGRFATERGLAWNVSTRFFVDDDKIYSEYPFVKWQPLSEFIARVRAGGSPPPRVDQ